MRACVPLGACTPDCLRGCVLPALLAAWLPVLISLGAGTLLLRQASR